MTKNSGLAVEYQEDHVNPEISAQDDEWFDLLPIEKKLCGISFGLGVALLVVFLGIFRF